MHYFPKLICRILLCCIPVAACSQELVRDQGITSPLHSANKGRIVFTDRAIAPGQLKPEDFLQSYQLTNKSNLFMTIFLNHSLTNAMKKIAPDLSADSLHRLSGYRFSCYLDNRHIYTSDIQGAPLPLVRDTETVVSKPLIDYQNDGAWWSQFFWNRFMRSGDSSLSDGRHLLRLELRAHVHNQAGEILATGELPLIVNRKPSIDLSKVQLQPLRPYPGLTLSSEPFDHNRIKELKGRIEDNLFRKINGIVVIKNGKLLIEEYFNGENRSSLHDPRSVGKSIASTMTGIAIRDGYLKTEQQMLSEFYDLKQFDHYTSAKDSVTIEDLLTMSACFDGDDNDMNSPGNEENMYPTDNWVKFALDLPVSNKTPRGQWHYFTSGVVVLGDLLHRSVPGGLEQYTHKKLFAPLGITYKWKYTPQKVVNTAGGIQLNALDFAKYGLLYKNGGRWNSKQLLPASWVEKSLGKLLPVTGRAGEYYGYLFWNRQYQVNGKFYEVSYCSGNGGNKVFIFKDQPLVVVITASAYNQPYAHTQVDKMMTEYILPAVLDQPSTIAK